MRFFNLYFSVISNFVISFVKLRSFEWFDFVFFAGSDSLCRIVGLSEGISWHNFAQLVALYVF